MTLVVRQGRAVIDGSTGTSILETKLIYDPHDPYAVTFQFEKAGAQSQLWIVDRQTLADALTKGSAGYGDVTVTCPSSGHTVKLTLSGEGGTGEVLILASLLRDFLADTTAVVPFGDETARLRIDEGLKRLLGAG